MKKLVVIMLLFLVVAGSLAADESKLFVVTRHISKIYIHRLGFKVVYVKTDMNLGEFYVPMDWFDSAGGKGVLIRGTDPSFPYFSVFWEEGEFHSIKLYTHQSLSHQTWGRLEHDEDVAQAFDTEEITIDF